MDPITLGIIGGAISVGCYMEEREEVKAGDVAIHREAERERLAERTAGSPKDVENHVLHPHHSLKFVKGDNCFRCDACTKISAGGRYRCESCNFDLHLACAVSSDIFTNLVAEKSMLNEFVHSHPLTLVSGSCYTCKHCNNTCKSTYKYYCEPCNAKFDLMCVTHPARLLSFFHPQHELQLKTRHHFKKCAVCRHGGDSNARVYSCELCQFYVHPACAVGSQYIKRAVHPEHFLVFAAVTGEVTCKACNKRCKRWCYLCPICEGVYFHPDCMDPSTSNGSSLLEQFGEEVAKEIAKKFAEQVISGLGNMVQNMSM